MAIKCEIVPEKCIACGLCQLIAPDIFDYDDAGIIIFLQEPEALHQFVDELHQESVAVAAKKCPARAILIQK